MRIAFVLQTYRLLDQVGRLVDTLNRSCPDRLIVITHSGSRKEIAAVVQNRGVDCVLPAVPGRGHFELIDSYISALRWLGRQERSYDWIVLLSGQDYPLRPLAQFCDALERSPFDGHFYFFDPLGGQGACTGPMSWPRRECEDRYLFRYSVLKTDLSWLARAALRAPRELLGLTHNYRLSTSFGLSVGRRANTPPFSPDFKLYGGSYWHIIRRECAEILLDFVDRNPDVVDYFRHVILPDECFIQTVLLNSKRLRISPDDLRYFDFVHSHLGHSKTLGPTDLDAALASKCYFGRKFDMSAQPEVLDMLDQRVFGLT